ncbi:hypothetical protein K2173_028361 [Erythroxylum novogranatense]|uniref:Uncharacterized protein n=1 Tax=Erythroxylum novogranatense TaxID=1862640 RepID=A0AAV8U4N3_9ROSI|nr:hypothetical protein K2173_028361 [Erythroxylum novogranatense]
MKVLIILIYNINCSPSCFSNRILAIFLNKCFIYKLSLSASLYFFTRLAILQASASELRTWRTCKPKHRNL